MSWVNDWKLGNKPSQKEIDKIYSGYTSNLRSEQIKANVKRGSYKRRIGEDR